MKSSTRLRTAHLDFGNFLSMSFFQFPPPHLMFAARTETETNQCLDIPNEVLDIFSLREYEEGEDEEEVDKISCTVQ